MTTELKIVATLVAKPGLEDQLRKLLEPAVHQFRQEPGCRSYALLEDRKQAGCFLTYETWADELALEQHMASPAMKELQPKLKDLLQGGIQQDFLSLLLDL